MSVVKDLFNLGKTYLGLTHPQQDTVSKVIQAVEGGKEFVNLENLLFAFPTQEIEGESNKYKNYTAQVIETYLRYNGLRDFGNWQTKAIIDIRTSFIAGEGLSITAIRKKTSKWIDNFLKKNKLNGSMLNRTVKGTEMTGKALLILKKEKDEDYVKAIRIPYGDLMTETGEGIKKGVNYKVYLKDEYDIYNVKKIVKVEGTTQLETTLPYEHFVYIVTGGDDSSVNEPVTKTGMVLTEIENYDRGLKELRRSNYYVNRITPDFECANSREAKETKNSIQTSKWKIGDARVGTAKFTYKAAPTSAHENTETELQGNAKAISTTTGVPVHWLGHVELMSNRATAQTLFEMVDNATKQERVVIQEGFYDLIIKAMEVDIDSGGSTLSEIDYDFEVKLPLISFHQFKDNIQALSQAYADRAISIDDYMNFIPGIDPIETKKAIEAEEKKKKEDFKTPEGDLNKEISDNLKLEEENSANNNNSNKEKFNG